MYENRSRCQFAAKFMPSLLSEAQKENHVNMCQGLQERLETDPEFFSKVITGDEMWVYGYHQKTKQDLSQWRSSSSPCPQKVRQVCWNVKYTLVGFSIFARLCIFFEKANPKLTAHTDTWHLQENVQCKVESGIYIVSPPWLCTCWVYFAYQASLWLKSNVNAHPTYSHDLVPWDFLLISELELALKGRNYSTINLFTSHRMCVDSFHLRPLSIEHVPVFLQAASALSNHDVVHSTDHDLVQCFSSAGPRPHTGPWHQLYRATRGSPGICHFSFLSIFHE